MINLWNFVNLILSNSLNKLNDIKSERCIELILDYHMGKNGVYMGALTYDEKIFKILLASCYIYIGGIQ